MDSMDRLREHLEAGEYDTEALARETRTSERRPRRWRGIAWGFLLVGLLTAALPSGRAAEAQLEARVAALTFDAAANEVVISGANLRIVNGLGTTEATNGLGNLIVGYNEARDFGAPDRPTGSHNVVVGREHNFSSVGGLVVGQRNEISGAFAAVSGGVANTASGGNASVSGGFANLAGGESASVSGGFSNTAGGGVAGVSGLGASVSGGVERSAPGSGNWAAGGLFEAF
jgi:hypothetical protein